MPPVLMQLRRHSAITTTMAYYVGRNAQTTAEVVWEAFRKGQADAAERTAPGAQKGAISGTIDQIEETAF
jgi:hypothetical protein